MLGNGGTEENGAELPLSGRSLQSSCSEVRWGKFSAGDTEGPEGSRACLPPH